MKIGFPHAVPVGLAAQLLGVCRQRVDQLIASGRLRYVSYCGARYVYVSSIHARRRKLSARKRKLPKLSKQSC